MVEGPDVPGRLRAAALDHRPDRERMLARVERGMAARAAGSAAGRRRPAGRRRSGGSPVGLPGWVRTTGVAAALVATLGGVTVTVNALTGQGETQPSAGGDTENPTDASAGVESPEATGGGAGNASAGTGDGGEADGHTSAGEAPTRGGTAGEAETGGGDPGAPDHGGTTTTGGVPGVPGDGDPGSDEPPLPVESDGIGVQAVLDPTVVENPYWSQSLLILNTERVLLELVVEVRLPVGEGISHTGDWLTLPAEEWETTVTRDGDDLVFRWRLREGAVVPVGEYTFAAQYDHPAGNRGVEADLFTVRGVAEDGTQVSSRGGFV
ncbi:hypothetical protein [Streptomyces alkaliphilus]|uniref:hypothetical protein n=1 Tax=Streptomyces alkaliphilus TaxID=1472722 RepID=UPI0011803F21|nr:hypothetical protein [Streptomyces alkaliphilus]MQS08202.1 hypothetical protein [Streptomyces alkaliphilus]